jgi:hypothetical protein
MSLLPKKAHSENRREWRSANAGDNGDMCEVMTGCEERALMRLFGGALLGNRLAPNLKPPSFLLSHVMRLSTESKILEES